MRAQQSRAEQPDYKYGSCVANVDDDDKHFLTSIILLSHLVELIPILATLASERLIEMLHEIPLT